MQCNFRWIESGESTLYFWIENSCISLQRFIGSVHTQHSASPWLGMCVQAPGEEMAATLSLWSAAAFLWVEPWLGMLSCFRQTTSSRRRIDLGYSLWHVWSVYELRFTEHANPIHGLAHSRAAPAAWLGEELSSHDLSSRNLHSCTFTLSHSCMLMESLKGREEKWKARIWSSWISSQIGSLGLPLLIGSGVGLERSLSATWTVLRTNCPTGVTSQIISHHRWKKKRFIQTAVRRYRGSPVPNHVQRLHSRDHTDLYISNVLVPTWSPG